MYPAPVSTIVTVYDAQTGSIAPLWNDRDGTDPKANPHNITSDGQIRFYANAGRYNIVAVNGSASRTWPDELIIDPDAGGGGGGASSFIDLDDVPSSYSGQAGKVAAVNSSANALEFLQFGPPLSVATATSSYTLALATWNQWKYLTGSGTIAITIPKDSTLNLPVGYVHIVRPRTGFSGTATWTAEDGTVTIEAPAGGTLVLEAGSACAAVKEAANQWAIFGITEAV